jgi:hypothetical protein
MQNARYKHFKEIFECQYHYNYVRVIALVTMSTAVAYMLTATQITGFYVNQRYFTVLTQPNHWTSPLSLASRDIHTTEYKF